MLFRASVPIDPVPRFIGADLFRLRFGIECRMGYGQRMVDRPFEPRAMDILLIGLATAGFLIGLILVGDAIVRALRSRSQL